jgi:CO/xanthine dehydrogenase Mo-binding subunit
VTAPTGTRARTDGGIGTDASRPDGTLKVTGEFAYGSDLWADEMLWGVTLRSPHPSARIRSIDLGPALAVPGVYAVLTADDVPGEKSYGLELDDQPVLATGVVRYQGEAVALVAAEHPETARRAAARIVVDYEVLDPVTDAKAALAAGAVQVGPSGNLIRHLKIRKGLDDPVADLVVEGDYEVGSSGRSPASRCRPRTVASTCSSPPSGCTSTRSRSAARWPCRPTRCASRWPASAVRSAVARTCPCTCTPACSRCTPASR